MACEDFNFEEANGCTHASVGMTFHYNILVKDEAGSAQPITGDLFSMVIMDAAGGNELLELVNTTDPLLSGFYVNDAATGDVDITITSADTIAIGAGVHSYQLVRTRASGEVILEGYGLFQFIDRRVV